MSAEDRPAGPPIVAPHAWNTLKHRSNLLAVAVVGIAFVLATGSVLDLTSGDAKESPRAVFIISGAVAFAVPMIVLRSIWQRAARAGWSQPRLMTTSTTGSQGTLISYSTLARNAVITVHVLNATAFTLMSVAVAAAMFQGDSSSSGLLTTGRAWAVAPFLPLAAAYSLGVVVGAVVRRRPLGMVMTPRGITHLACFGSVVIPWDQIETIRPDERGFGPRVQLVVGMSSGRDKEIQEHATGFALFPGFAWYRRRLQAVPAGFLRLNPAVAYYALCFYHRHAELRHELGTEASVERIQAGDMDDAIEEVRRYGEVRPEYWH